MYTTAFTVCCRVYKAQFLKRMGRLLDNLPEKDTSTASQCTTPPIQHSSSSLREMDSADTALRNLPSTRNLTRPTSVPSLTMCLDSDDCNPASCESVRRDITSSVQSTSTSQLQTSVSVTEKSRALTVSTSDCSSASVTAQNALRASSRNHFYNVCLPSQQTSRSHNVSVKQLPHSRLDISITRDVLPSCVSMLNSSSRDGLPCVTVSSSSERSGFSCITTPSSSGRGGLSSYDKSSLHSVSSANAEGLDILRSSSSPHWHGQLNTSNRPLNSVDWQRTSTTRSVAACSDWITRRN